MSAASILAAAALGAATGSFVGVVADRVPHGQALGGRSHCQCGALVPARHNIPVVSWLWLRGRAACCGAAIPARYLAHEAGLAAAFAAVAQLTIPWWGHAAAATGLSVVWASAAGALTVLRGRAQ